MKTKQSSFPRILFLKSRLQRGVLLLEVLISILIFSFAILGIVALQARIVEFSINTEMQDSARELALELAGRAQVYQSLDNAVLATTDWQNKAVRLLPGIVNASKTAPISGVSKIGGSTVDNLGSITIAWTDKQSKSYTYTTRVVLNVGA